MYIHLLRLYIYITLNKYLHYIYYITLHYAHHVAEKYVIVDRCGNCFVKKYCARAKRFTQIFLLKLWLCSKIFP